MKDKEEIMAGLYAAEESESVPPVGEVITPLLIGTTLITLTEVLIDIRDILNELNKTKILTNLKI